MNEFATLEKIIGKGQTEVQVKSTKRLPNTTESKYQVKADLLRNARKREISLIEYKNPQSSYIKDWEMLKEAGVSVVPTMRIYENSVFMTDLKAGGGEFYGKSKKRELSNSKIIKRRKTDDIFFRSNF